MTANDFFQEHYQDKTYQVPTLNNIYEFMQSLNLWNEFIRIQLQTINYIRKEFDVETITFQEIAHNLTGICMQHNNFMETLTNHLDNDKSSTLLTWTVYIIDCYLKSES